MGMKEAFETFFYEMDRNILKVTGELPSIPCPHEGSSTQWC